MRSLSWLHRFACVLPLACCATCAESELRPITQVVVAVAGDARIDTLSISLQTENGRNVSDARRITLATREDGRHLPSSFTLLPPGEDMDAVSAFRLVIVGEQSSAMGNGSTPLVRSIVVASFAPGKTLLLPVVLDTSCVAETCGCSFTQDTCAVTCLPPGIGREAGCRAVPRYARLAEVTPGQELTQLDEGAGGCAPGEELGPNALCTDLDECAWGFHLCSTEPPACVNEVSGALRYRCQCPSGMRGTGIGPDGCR